MLQEELEDIVAHEKDVLPFLKKLNPKDKKALVPFLKKLLKKIYEYRLDEKGYGPIYTNTKRDIVDKTCFVCFTKKDALKTWQISSACVSNDYLENIIPWYTPSWYSDLINETIPHNLSYEKMMQLCKEGILQPARALIVDKLPTAIIELERSNDILWKRFYRPKVLLKYKETLEEHIWFLFEEESTINYHYSYLNIENYNNSTAIWIDTIVRFTDEKLVDRKKVLLATLHTANRGFNKTLSGWFFNLLIALNPTADEIIVMQDDFFAALTAPHSKVVNTVLQLLKPIITQKEIQQSAFIEQASLLVHSETKSVVRTTLMLLEKIAKTYKATQPAVCKAAAEALANADETLQHRAAKLIVSYGNSNDTELLEAVQLHTETLLHSSKALLKAYGATHQAPQAAHYKVESVAILSKENQLPTYETVDDLIFFVSQAIDNNAVYHVDLLLSALPKLNARLQKEDVAKLEPIFKRAFKLSKQYELSNSIGYLEQEAAYCINDFAALLVQKYPSELKNVEKLVTQDQGNSLEIQSVDKPMYQLYRFLGIQSKSLQKKGLALALLSTPTHAPCWIAPSTLIDRIIAYEAHNEPISLHDFQIAIGRLPLQEYPAKSLEHLKKIKDEQIKKVLQYHFDLLTVEHIVHGRPELWLQSVLSKNKDSDLAYCQKYLDDPLQKERSAYPWQCEYEDYVYEAYDSTAKTYAQKKVILKKLRLQDFELQAYDYAELKNTMAFNQFKLPNTQTQLATTQNKAELKKKKKRIRGGSIYEYLYIEGKHEWFIEPNDAVKFLFLSPNNPGVFLSHIVYQALDESSFYSIPNHSKRVMVQLLKGLHEIWYLPDFKPTTYLFLAASLLYGDKVVREIAAEIVIKAIAQQTLNIPLLGETLGKLEAGEYAPLKRFTDVITSHLLHLSQAHDTALFQLLNTMISTMYDEPIKGLKKLLELFLELKHHASTGTISPTTQEKLSQWQRTKSLKPLVQRIL